MPVVRELIALLSAKVDEQSFHEAQSRMFRLRTAVGGAVAGFATKSMFDFGEMSARFEDAKKIMEANGQSLDDLRAKSRGLFSDFDLVTNYNRANQFGLGEAFPEMLKIADAAGTLLGEKQDYMLNRITTGLAKMSPARLDELGILISRKELYKGLAEEMGVSERSLDEQLKKQRLVKDALAQGAQIQEKVNKVGAVTGQEYDRIGNRVKAIQLAVGKLTNVFIQGVSPALEKAAKWMDRVGESAAAQRFFGELANVAYLASRFIGSLVYDLGVLLDVFVKIPGAGYILTGLLGVKLVTAAYGMTKALAMALPVVQMLMGTGGFAGVTLSLQSLQWAMVAFASTWIPIAATWAAGAAALTVIVLMLEEIFAVFDPQKIGLFEKWAGRWEELLLKLGKQPTTGGWETFFKYVKMGIVSLIGYLETFTLQLSNLGLAALSFGQGRFVEGFAFLKEPAKAYYDTANKQTGALADAEAWNNRPMYGPENFVPPTAALSFRGEKTGVRAPNNVAVSIVVNAANADAERVAELVRAKFGEERARMLREANEASDFEEVP